MAGSIQVFYFRIAQPLYAPRETVVWFLSGSINYDVYFSHQTFLKGHRGTQGGYLLCLLVGQAMQRKSPQNQARYFLVRSHFSKNGLLKVSKAFFSRICHGVVFTQFGYADSKSAPCQAQFCVFPFQNGKTKWPPK